MRHFNALQLVSLFAAGPFIITYVKDADFYAHTVLFWVAIACYVVGYFALTAVVADAVKDL